jgi:hypothetical protein
MFDRLVSSILAPECVLDVEAAGRHDGDSSADPTAAATDAPVDRRIRAGC